MTWQPTFETLVRANAPLLPASKILDADIPLRDLGIDSMGTVQLLVEVETEFGVAFPDELLTPETFETPASLWRALESICRGSTDHAGASGW